MVKPLKLLFFWCMIFAAIAVSYRGGGSGDFVWDDRAFMVGKAAIRNADSAKDLLFQPFAVSKDYYRPLVVITFGLQYKLVGLNAASFHWVNIVIHALNVIVLVLLIRRLIKGGYREGIAFAAGLIYAVHPAMIEAVGWISGRFDLLMTLLLLLALYAESLNVNARIKAVFTGLFFLGAACSKEAAVGFCLALPFYHLFLQRLSSGNSSLIHCWREHKWTYIAIFTSGCVYLFLRFVSMGYLTSGLVYNDYGTGLQRLLLSSKALVTYLYMLVFPFGKISPLHFEPFPVSLNDSVAWLALIFCGFFCLFLLLPVVRRSRWTLLAAALLPVVFSLIPSIHILQTPLQDSLVQERYLQFPLALFLLSVALYIQKFELLRGAGVRIAGSVTAVFFLISYITIRATLPLWQTDVALWSWVTASEPKAQAGWANLSAAYLQLGELDKAEHAARVALEMGGKDMFTAYALVNLGGIASAKGNLDEAADYFLRAINLSRQVPGALINMANTLIRMREFESAKWYLDVASDVAKDEPNYYINFGLYWLALGEKSRANEQFQKGLSLIDVSVRKQYALVLSEYLNGVRTIAFKNDSKA